MRLAVFSGVLGSLQSAAGADSAPPQHQSIRTERNRWEGAYGAAFPGKWCGVESRCGRQRSFLASGRLHADSRDVWLTRWLRTLQGGLYGLEIGACAMPVNVGSHIHVTYIDRDLSTRKGACGFARDRAKATLRDDAGTLRAVSSQSVDFVIANHVLEHVEDFLGALQTWLRVVRPGGFVFTSLPDMCDPLWKTGERFRLATHPYHLARELVTQEPSLHLDEGAIMLWGMVQPAAQALVMNRTNLAMSMRDLIAAPYLIHRHAFTETSVQIAIRMLKRVADVGFVLQEIHVAERTQYTMQEHRIVLRRVS